MKRIFLNSAFTLVLLLPAGCGIYTKYQRPETAFADSLYLLQTKTDKADTTSLADLSWRELFSDSQLRELITKGLNNNTDLRIARSKVREAEATLKASRMAFFPSVSFDADGSVKHHTAGSTSKSYSAAISAGWELDIFGRLRNAKKGAAAALEQSYAYEQAVQTQLIATIANSYYTLLMLDEQLRISRRTLDNWEKNIRALAALKRAGKTNETAVLQAKANRLDVERSALTLEKQIAEQQNALCSLLGIVPQTIKRATLAEQQFPKTLSVGLPLQLVNRRPDVRQAEYALAEAFYATNAARSAFYPKITLGGSAGWTFGSNTIADPGTWLLSALGSLAQPVFANGQNRTRLKIAKEQQEQALVRFKQQLLDAGIEVNNALTLWQTSLQRLDVDKKRIVHLRAAVWNTTLLMKYGQTNYLEVLTAQQNLLQAELAEASDKYDEIQGVISLFHALGGGTK